MTKDSTAGSAASLAARPAFHIRRLREAYDENGLSPDELAYLAGVPPALLDSLERCPALPPVLEALARIAFALQAPLADLINDQRLAGARAGIVRRRERREGGDRPPIGFAVSDA